MTKLSFNSRRSPVYGRKGIVATSQPLATSAGLEILTKGGNAADAAVAAGAALNVTEPMSTGIGGDMFALYYSAEAKTVTALNGSGRTPAALSLDKLKKEGFSTELPRFHVHTVTVPGACAGWFDLIKKHGSLPMDEILSPAIRLAREGFPVGPITSHAWTQGVNAQLNSAPNGHELTIDGRAPAPGDVFRNPGLARTFEAIVRGGASAFYQGEIAEAIVGVVKEAGGCLSENDLASHLSTWEEPISVTYRGYRVFECPPNGQGITALIALNILEGFDLAEYPSLSMERSHLMIEAMRLAFADARWYVSDPAFSNIPIKELLSKEYAKKRRKLIDKQRAIIDPQRGTPVSSSDTVYLSVVDQFGNACSFINSNYWGFGTGIIPKDWGFTLQNRGHNFSLDPAHPNALAPLKRPYHTIIPAMVTRETDDSLYASYGVMGGFMQPQGHVQVLSALVDDGLDPQAALDLPRFCIDVEESGGRVALEEGTPNETFAGLEKMGHPVYSVNGFERSLFGRGQVILRDPVIGVLSAGSDPRADGCAMSEG
ncbi:MAG: gamma-glutamyltransferase [Anaerolineae bacterium]|jgi:gamma-glutamyltranspeptidase/glutathione hydrolase|nr:gamma-glutamyltransferase [Anaerolineae bacterium]MBT4308824.1 gamma-glutamyltransferase [Anaerolineae bacterium]MBT4457905.1 gamma-glutamyltransferase [Anaerolineae bacterium]MBT4842094.1 gamma-glutamyltransferase [Anaerolineae bacterium]MBT6060273.1 gamma-glutamyltransferase [Anaerolineae bacterium]